MIIALGESIVAIGVGASGDLDLGIGTAAVLGVALAAAMWWIYFDVVALISARRLARRRGGPVPQRARPRLLLLHPPADGRRHRARRPRPEDDDRPRRRPPARIDPAFALLGGPPLYLLGLVAFRYRQVRTINRQRLGLAIALSIAVPVATAVPALLSLAVVQLCFWAMIGYEHRGYSERRDQLRREAASA